MSLDATAPSFAPAGSVAPPVATQKHALDDASAPAEPDAKRAREQEATRFDFPGPLAERFLAGGGEELGRQVKVLLKKVDSLESEFKEKCEPLEKRVDSLESDVKEKCEPLEKRVDSLESELKEKCKPVEKRVDGLESEVKEKCKPVEKKVCEGAEKTREGVEDVKREEEGRKLKKWQKVLIREEEEMNIWRMVLVSSVCVTCAVLGGFVGAMAERGWVKGRFVDAAWSSVKGN